MIRPIIFVVSVDGKEVLEARDASYADDESAQTKSTRPADGMLTAEAK